MSAARHFLLAGLAALALAAIAPAPAGATFGFLPGSEGFAASLTNQDGSDDTLAGTHPYAFHLSFGLNAAGGFADGDLREAQLEMPPGLLINPTAVSQCSAADFNTPRASPFEQSRSGESCPNAAQVGVAAVRSGESGGETRYFGLFNLTPPHGSPGAIGLAPYGVPIVLTPHVREADAGLSFDLHNLSQSFDLQRLELTIWGTPWAIVHDSERGNCLNEGTGGSFGACLAFDQVNAPFEQIKSYVTLPTGPCGAPLDFAVSARSWQGGQVQAAAQSPALAQCNRSLSIPKVALTSEEAAVGTGLAFTLDVNDGGGILNPKGIARPAIRRAVVALPEGLTLNPSVAVGLGACAPEQFAREQVGTVPGEGCPNASKLGEVRVDGMLGLPDPVQGSVFLAEPHRNPFGALVALYLVARDPARGLLVKAVGELEPDPRSGRLLVTFEDLPRLLYTRFTLSLREGQRPLLVTPPACGLHHTAVTMTSWAASDPPSNESSTLQIASGPGGGPCPGAPPFAPGLEAGSRNANAGFYAPFYLHLTRSDADQEITSYSATFPPGLLGRIAGIPFCPEAAIAAAKGRSGNEEAARPSCPAQSQIGRTLAGYGVGGVLAYAPGALYLAGPYRGAPLSVVAIDSARIGPFDLGTIVVRAAIRIDRRSARASIDPAGSDPIPHILAGFPIHLRDIRVYVDRPGFTLNPTRCDPLATTSTLTGAGADFFNPADDVVATATDPFQLLNCSALGFVPRLALRLRGGARHGRYPSLRATYRTRPGDANLARAVVTLPPSLFLAQEHIDEVCTAAQFAAERCPAGSVYGRARAITRLLDEPLEGPVYLRSSANTVPDLVASLHARGIAIELDGRIDATNGGLRATFTGLPDAPVTSFTMTLSGARRDLLVNAEDLCAAPQRAGARFTAQSGTSEALRPRLRMKCPGRHGHHHRHRGTR